MRPIHLDHGPARFQASGEGLVADSVTSVASCSIDASFCLVFKKLTRQFFVAHPLLKKIPLAHEILKHGMYLVSTPLSYSCAQSPMV